MLKIAILVREETTDRCTGKGCLRSFFSKTESFARYSDTEVELVGFFHSGGDLEGFLDNEANRYREQLQRYKEAMAITETLPIKTALYFPLLDRFYEV